MTFITLLILISRFENLPKRKRLYFGPISDKLNQLQSQAVVLLIYEHSLVMEELTFLPDPLVLPYGGKQKKTSVSFDFDLLPSNLKWILFKFFEVLNVPING